MFGIYVGLQVDNWSEQRDKEARGSLVVQAIKVDLNDRHEVGLAFRDSILTGLSEWEMTRLPGERPPPYYFRVNGSETPPNNIWEAITQEGLTELVSPNLIFDLGYYFSESMGINIRYVRYAEFTESEILPWLGHADETTHFYGDGATLKPEFQGHMDRISEYAEMLSSLLAWEECLLNRLENPQSDFIDCSRQVIPL